MAFFQLTLKARKLEKMRLLYQDEKMRSIEVSKGAKIHYTFFQKIRLKKILLKKRLKKWFKRVTSCPEDSWFHEKSVLLRTDGTFENYILKSVIGFIGGIFLTYMFFMFFIFQLNFTLSSATLLCSLFGIILTIGLAFSYRVRCVVFLLLPQFFSKRGRQALMAYAFILALTGPAKNTLHNMGVLSESLACGQEQLKAAVRAIVDLIKQPFYALRDSMAKVMRSIRLVVKKIKEALLAIKRIVLSILKVIKAVFQWLGSIMNICNKKLGTPFERCQKVFDGAVADCKASLGPLFGGICNLVYVVSLLCWVVKPFDFICMLISFITDSIVGVVRRKIKKFAKHVKAMFYVKVKFSHSFHFETNQSKSLEEVATGIVTEIRSRTDKFLTVFDWMSFATSFFFMFMMLRVIHYRHKWLTSERFDNRYLTNDLRDIDLRRARLDKETVLPLNPRERNKYIPLTSITLIKAEKIKLTKSAVFLSLTTLKLGIHMMADYSLYWMLSTIRYHGRFESKVETPNSVGIYVSGNGFLADLYRSIVRAFSPLGVEVDMDTMPCLPDPIPPDLDRYTQIISLIFFCWIMAIFEPYGLRLRHVVMCYYHPDRARQRSVWLYNHIIRSRGSFLKFARRQLRRRFTKSDKKEIIEKVTFKERLVAMCPILHNCFGADKRVCLLCGAVERESQPPLIKCPKPGCTGLFCLQCFADLQNLCTICLEPIDYGDLSDMSEERDSSDGQIPTPCGQKLKDKLRADALKREKMKSEKEVVKEEKEDQGKDRIDVEKEKEGEQEEEEEEEEEEEDLSEECEEEEEEDDEDDADVDEEECEDEENSIKNTLEGAADELDESESCSSSSSTVYSYSYQDESPGDVDITQQRIPYKDVEAQKIRDDVTIQVFNDPLTEEESSSSVSEDLRNKQKSRKIKRRIDRKDDNDHGKSTESPYDAQSTSTASIADTESLPTEEVDEEDVIQEEIDEEYEEEKLLPEKTRNKSKKRNRIKKIVAILSKPFSKKGCEPRCPGRSIKNEKSTFFNKIVNLVQTEPQMHSECPRAAYRHLQKSDLIEKSRIMSESSSSDPEEVVQTVRSSSMSNLSSPQDLIEILSPRKDQPRSDDVNLSEVNRMQEIQHLEDSISSGDNFYSKTYDSHRKRGKKVNKKPCKRRRKEEPNVEYPHEKKFETKQLPRYLKPFIEETRYDEINEREIYGTPRIDKDEKSMNKLTDTKTTSSSSSARDMWNIKSGDDECDLCFCSKDSSLSSLDALRSPIDNYKLNMSTIEERSDESSLRSDLEETTDEIIDVTGISSATSGINLNKENEYNRKRSNKRLVTADKNLIDEETRPPGWKSKKARRETSALILEEKMQNIGEKDDPRGLKYVSRSWPKIGGNVSIDLAEELDIDEQKIADETAIDADNMRKPEKRKRCRRINESPGEKKRKKRVGRESREVEEKQYEIENKVESDNKRGATKRPKEVTKKERFGNILKVFDFSGEKIGSRNESVSKLIKNVETKTRQVQTDSLDFEKKLNKSEIVTQEDFEIVTSSTNTTTETEESKEVIKNTDEFAEGYQQGKRRCKGRQAGPQKHRKSPRKSAKSGREKSHESYYTDPEDSPRKRDPESYRSTFSDEELSSRRIFASEHRKFLPRETCGDRIYCREINRRLEQKDPRRYREDNNFVDRMEDHDRRSRYCPEFENFENRYRRRNYFPGEYPVGQFSPDYRFPRYPASGDSAPDRNEYRYTREYSPERNIYGYESSNRDNIDRRRLCVDERFDSYPRTFGPEDGRRQRVRDMFELGYNRREYPRRERELSQRYNNPPRSNYDYDNYYRNYNNHAQMHGAVPIRQIPMYDPSSPTLHDTRTFPAEAATIRYPQRYPSPRAYSEGVDPYYGISSPPLNFCIPYDQPLPEERSRYSPTEPIVDGPTSEGIDGRYYDLSSPTQQCCVPYDKIHERSNEVPEETPKIQPKSRKDQTNKSFMNVPILKKFLPIFQKPELITELKEHDRMKLIQEREARERTHEFTQTTRIPMPLSTIQSETSGSDVSKIETPRASSTSDARRANSENRLPYQETEAFKEVVNEYEQRRSSKQQKRKFSDDENLNITSQQADASTDVTQLYPLKEKGTATMSRIASSFMNAFSSFSTLKKDKFKESSSPRINQPSSGPSERVRACKVKKCMKKIPKQGRKFEVDDPREMSSVELNPFRKKNKPSQSVTTEEDEEDTTDNNETTR